MVLRVFFLAFVVVVRRSGSPLPPPPPTKKKNIWEKKNKRKTLKKKRRRCESGRFRPIGPAPFHWPLRWSYNGPGLCFLIYLFIYLSTGFRSVGAGRRVVELWVPVGAGSRRLLPDFSASSCGCWGVSVVLLKFCTSLNNFTGFYRVFIGFNWVFLSFTGFYRVLLGFTGFYRVLPNFTGFYRVLLGFTGFYRILLGFTGFYWVLPGFTRFYWIKPSLTGLNRVLSAVIQKKTEFGQVFTRLLPSFNRLWTNFYRV